MRAKTSRLLQQAAIDRQRRLHALNRLKAAERQLHRKLSKLCKPRR